MFLISKCCAGVKCRYRGNGYFRKLLLELGEREDYVAVCPEMMGGLTLPREGCNVEGDRIIGRRTRRDYTTHYKLGAERTLALCQKLGITRAYLLHDSPSCGKNYGLTARLLESAGVDVISI